MNTKKSQVIEAEIIDENGQVVSAETIVKDHARPQNDNGGILGSLLVLTVGFFATVAVILFSVFILCPVLLVRKLVAFIAESSRR